MQRPHIHMSLIALCTLAIVALLPLSPAHAQTDAATAQAATSAGEVYASPMRAQCEDELIKDIGWRAELKKQLAPEVHQEDADLMLTNRRHVVAAYAVLWIVLLLFVVFMWLRQQRLTGEIARLERDLRQASADNG